MTKKIRISNYIDLPEELPAIYVEWLDHCTYHGWRDTNEKFRPMLVRTLGFLVTEDSLRIVVSSAQASTGDVADPTTILKNDILLRQEVAWV